MYRIITWASFQKTWEVVIILRFKYLFMGIIVGLILSSSAFAQTVREYVLTIPDYTVIVRGTEYVDEVYPILNYYGTTYVPLRFISELLDVDIVWNETLKRVEVGNGDDSMMELHGDGVRVLLDSSGYSIYLRGVKTESKLFY